nr:hypothetical protein TetV2_00152 [Oceanusvirus sp.]
MAANKSGKCGSLIRMYARDARRCKTSQHCCLFLVLIGAAMYYVIVASIMSRCDDDRCNESCVQALMVPMYASVILCACFIVGIAFASVAECWNGEVERAEELRESLHASVP